MKVAALSFSSGKVGASVLLVLRHFYISQWDSDCRRADLRPCFFQQDRMRDSNSEFFTEVIKSSTNQTKNHLPNLLLCFLITGVCEKKKLFRICFFASQPFTIYTYQKLEEAAAKTRTSPCLNFLKFTIQSLKKTPLQYCL